MQNWVSWSSQFLRNAANRQISLFFQKTYIPPPPGIFYLSMQPRLNVQGLVSGLTKLLARYAVRLVSLLTEASQLHIDLKVF